MTAAVASQTRSSGDGASLGSAPRPDPTSAGAGNALTISASVAPGERGALLALLQGYGRNIRRCLDIDFARLETVHFLRWVIVDTHEDQGQGTLMLESNHDGTPGEHIDDLLRVGAAGIHAIYSRCQGYPVSGSSLLAADFPAVKRYLLGGTIPNHAVHVGAHGKSARRIHLENDVRAAISSFLDRRRRAPGWPPSPEALHREIRDEAEQLGLLDRLRSGSSPAPQVRNQRVYLGLAGMLARYFLAIVPALVILRFKEWRDRQASYDSDPARTGELAEREDELSQNQLTHLVSVKPGFFRPWLLRRVLGAIHLLARYHYNQGKLGGISTIHFARWSLIDRDRKLVFFSNYDGSWESYLGDFIDKAASGLTAVWSNTEDFPRTRWLTGAGARDEERFKSWARAHQLETPLWYSAYPDLTVRNILQNDRICRGLLQRPADPEALLAWLGEL
jgi:hypothetical protein